MSSAREATALVLCGGRGARLHGRTDRTPKPLVPVNGRPMLAHILEQLVRQGLSRVVLATGHLSEQVEAFAAGLGLAPPPIISNAGAEASMLARLHHARPALRGVVVVCYGDTFIDIDFGHLVATHLARGRLATMVTGKIRNPFGVVSLDHRQAVISFTEKPVQDYYIGCFVCSQELLALASPELLALPDGQGLIALFQRLIGERQLAAYPFTGLQLTFNTELELSDARARLRSYHTLREDT